MAEDLEDCLDYGEEEEEEEDDGRKPGEEEKLGEEQVTREEKTQVAQERNNNATLAKKDEEVKKKTKEEEKEEVSEREVSTGWAQFAVKEPPQADPAEEKTTHASKPDLGRLLDVLSQKRPEQKNTENAKEAKGNVSSSSSSAKNSGVMSSRTVMVKPLESSKAPHLESHFLRYGEIEKVVLVGQVGFVIFKDRASAHRSFVNRAPVMKDTTIQLFRVRDGSEADVEKANQDAVKSPNRVIGGQVEQRATKHEVKGVEQAVSAAEKEKKKVEDASEDEKKKEKKTSESSETNKIGGLYGSISLFATPGVGGSKGNQEASSQERVRPEKRTWSRAGLPNMNDKEVLKAKATERQAQQRLKLAKEEVQELMKQLKAQNEQFALLGTDSKTIGKNLRSELKANINLLMAQLRHAKQTMTIAKNGIATAKQAVETAIENSKKEG